MQGFFFNARLIRSPAGHLAGSGRRGEIRPSIGAAHVIAVNGIFVTCHQSGQVEQDKFVARVQFCHCLHRNRVSMRNMLAESALSWEGEF